MVQTGKDDRSPYGLDSPSMVFLATHGAPTGWGVPGGGFVSLKKKQVRVGDENLRYLWMCSCHVLAHGRPVAADGGDYTAPATFTGGKDRREHRNAYARWKAALGPDLRLVCGGSGEVCANRQQSTDQIWDRYGNHDWQIADSFIDGLLAARSGVALCMTRGGAQPVDTPLYDQTFTRDANRSAALADADAYLHLLYPAPFPARSAVPPAPQPPPRRQVYPMFVYDNDFGLTSCPEEAPERVDENTCKSREGDPGPRAVVDRRSGATYLQGAAIGYPMALPSEIPTADPDYREAQAEVTARGWLEPVGAAPADARHATPAGARLIIESARFDSDGKNAQRSQKAFLVRFRRVILVEVPGGIDHVPTLGPGGEVSLLVNNAGTMVRGSRVERAIAGSGVDVKMKPVLDPEAALTKLLTRAGVAEELEYYHRTPVETIWGYREEAGNCRQKVLRIVYQFSFEPQMGFDYYGRLTLEIPAQELDQEPQVPVSPCFADDAGEAQDAGAK
jgi:hypothetical protein